MLESLSFYVFGVPTSLCMPVGWPGFVWKPFGESTGQVWVPEAVSV